MRVAYAFDNPANAVAAALTGRDYISYSQLKLFQRCPLRWYFAYVEGSPPESVNASLAFGGSIHAAIERYYQAQLAGEATPGVAELLKTFDLAWQDESQIPIQFSRDDTAKSLRHLADNLLTAFLESDHAAPDGHILGVEEELRRPAAIGLPDLLARIDLIVVREDALVVRDFKTASKRWSAADRDDAAAQLLLYAELVQPMAEAFELPVALEFVVLTKTRSPVIERHPVEFDRQRLAHTRLAVRNIWAAMQAGHVYPNPSPMNCSGCPHRTACRNWRG